MADIQLMIRLLSLEKTVVCAGRIDLGLQVSHKNTPLSCHILCHNKDFIRFQLVTMPVTKGRILSPT